MCRQVQIVPVVPVRTVQLQRLRLDRGRLSLNVIVCTLYMKHHARLVAAFKVDQTDRMFLFVQMCGIFFSKSPHSLITMDSRIRHSMQRFRTWMIGRLAWRAALDLGC